MSDTPRTDALIYRKNTIEMQRHELLDLALALERELAEAKSQLAETVAKERERCAKIIEQYTGAWDDEGFALAAKIRKGEEMSRLIPTYIEQSLRIEQLERELAAAQAKILAMRKWVNNNMTFYDVEPDGPDVCTSGPNIPTHCAVSKRIWYHATDNQTVSLFSEVIDAAMKEGGK
jgi:hypothetical protein